MQRFYCITKPNQKKTNESLKAACAERNIEFKLCDPDTFIPTEENMPKIGDMMYRVSVDSHYGVSELEVAFLTRSVTSFYKDDDPKLASIVARDSFFLNDPSLSKVRVPKTFNYLPKNREALDLVIDRLGGYPVVIKVSGGSHGVGVLLVESKASMYSLTDYLRSTGEQIVLKEFIQAGNESARLVVLGDRVIDSIKYTAPTGDFRSNEGVAPNVTPHTYNKAVHEVAVAAVKALGIEFGGVDMLIDEEENGYVVEVNLPNYFVRCEEITGTDISGKMLDYLLAKAR